MLQSIIRMQTYNYCERKSFLVLLQASSPQNAWTTEVLEPISFASCGRSGGHILGGQTVDITAVVQLARPWLLGRHWCLPDSPKPISPNP